MTTNVGEFQLTIRSDKKVYVTRLPGGQADLEPADIDLDPVRRDTIRVLVGMLRSGRLEDRELPVLGSNLYKVLLANKIGDALRQAVGLEQLTYSRVVLQFAGGDEIQELSSWPWEYLYDPLDLQKTASGHFLASLHRLILIRSLPLILIRSLPSDRDSRPFSIDKLPIRVLFIASSPSDYPEVSYTALEQELSQIACEEIEFRSLIGEYVPRDVVRSDSRHIATLDSVLNELHAYSPHVIHFVGHGQWCTDDQAPCGKIALQNPDRTARWVSAA